MEASEVLLLCLSSSSNTTKRRRPLDLPPSFEDHCVTNLKWSLDWTKRAILAYRQFIKLKVQHEEYSSNANTTSSSTAEQQQVLLEPSPTVRQVWQQHILHVQQYVQACQDYTGGHLIEHQPGDSQGEEWRIYTTKIALVSLFGKPNVDWPIWDYSDSSNHSPNNAQQQQQNNNPQLQVPFNSPPAAVVIGRSPVTDLDLDRPLQYQNNPYAQEETTLQLPSFFSSHDLASSHDLTPEALVIGCCTPTPFGGGWVSPDKTNHDNNNNNNNHDNQIETHHPEKGDADNTTTVSSTGNDDDSCITSSTISLHDSNDDLFLEVDPNTYKGNNNDERILVWLHTGKGIQSSERYRIHRHAPLAAMIRHHVQRHAQEISSPEMVRLYFQRRSSSRGARANHYNKNHGTTKSSSGNNNSSTMIEIQDTDTPFALGMQNGNSILVHYIEEEEHQQDDDAGNADFEIEHTQEQEQQPLQEDGKNQNLITGGHNGTFKNNKKKADNGKSTTPPAPTTSEKAKNDTNTSPLAPTKTSVSVIAASTMTPTVISTACTDLPPNHGNSLSNGHDNRNNKNHNNKNTNKQSQRSNITPNHHNNTKHSQRKPTTPTTARTSTTAKASVTTDDGGNDRITLQIQDCKSGMTVPLKVRKRTPLERIFVDLYLKRSKGESQIDAFLAQHQFWCHERVLFGGDITDSSSPLDFGLQDMDVIECRPLSTR